MGATADLVCSGKRTGPSGRPRGGDRRALELQPRRKVVEHGREDLLECGHRLPNPYGNGNKSRHCPHCPPLTEPVSEAARLRIENERLRGVLSAVRACCADEWNRRLVPSTFTDEIESLIEDVVLSSPLEGEEPEMRGGS